MQDEMIFSKDGRKLTCGEFAVASGNVFELGGWQSYLKGEDLTYAKKRDQALLYAYDFYHVTAQNVVVGYFIGYDKNMPYSTQYANAYDRVYEIIDLSVDCGELDETCGKLLLAYAKHLAKRRGCSAIVVKRVEEYFTFNRFLTEAAGAREIGEVYYLPVGRQNAEAEEASKAWEFLRAKAGENISTESLYFLKGAEFSVGESVCVRVFKNGEKITVDRQSGDIFYPDFIQNLGKRPNVNDELDRAALYHICLCMGDGDLTQMQLNVPYMCADGKTRILGAFHDQTAVLFEGEGEYVFDGKSKNKYGENVSRLSAEDEKQLLNALEREGKTKLVRNFGTVFDFVMGTVEAKTNCMPLFFKLRNLEKKEDEQTPKKGSLQRYRDLTARFLQFQSLTVTDGEKQVSVRTAGDGLIYRNERGEEGYISDADNKRIFLNRLQTIAAADWDKFYQSACDGAWRVEITFLEGEPLSFEGEGAYPLVWKRLKDLLENCERAK